MALKTYHTKRNFKKTTEPYGKKAVTHKKQIFVVQKHAASHLHYDFRLQIGSVLKSWAIPKGPSLDPATKRLAVHVEDHPIEYGSFEGTIPAGQYGGGNVMLWDKGEWEMQQDDSKQAYNKGSMTFLLTGKKLNGLWKLVRIKQDPKNWLLIKVKDKYARAASYDITKKQALSVVSLRSIDEIGTPKTEAKRTRDWLKVKCIKRQEFVVIGFTKPQGQRKYFGSLSDIKLKKTTHNKKLRYPLTNPDRILYPAQGTTKLELAQFYDEIQQWILPHIINRPLSLVRCPQGRHKDCFYQKHLDESSKFIYSVKIKEKSKTDKYIYIKDLDGLIALVQLGTLEIHPWECRIDKIEKPDRMIFDLDPAPEVPWKKVIQAARYIKKQLDNMKLKSFVKTTGGKGLHIVIPIKPQYSWTEVKNFSHLFVMFLVSQKPNDFIGTMNKSKRSGKIFIDYLRNQRGATAVAAYSTRAQENASVSTPLAWDELSTRVKSNSYTINNLPKRLSQLKTDPWKGFFKLQQLLPTDKVT